MSGEHKEIIETCIIDRYLENGDIDGLYGYMCDKKKQELELHSMLEIWALEKGRVERTIFWDVFSYKNAMAKYHTVSQVLTLIVNKAEVSLPIIQFAVKEISVWAVLIWTMGRLQGMKQILALEAVVCFWKEHCSDAEKIRILETVYMEELQKLLSEALAHQDGYLAKRLLVKLPDKKQAAELFKEAEEKICQVEERIQGRLYTPTSLETWGGVYFIVDCWHDRVLYSRELCDIKDWDVLDGNLQHPHSICKGRGIYAVENTENNSICLYRIDQSAAKLGELSVGERPHRLLYDDSNDMFWVLAGSSQEIYGIRTVAGRTELCFRQKIKELGSSYVRSMRIIGNRFYVVSGPGYILELSYNDGKFAVENKYAVPEEYYSMNDIIYFQGYFWITVYLDSRRILRPALLRLRSLEDFGTERCVDLYDALGMKGVPYFFSWVDGKLCIPEIDTHSRIVLYDADHGELKVNRVLYDFGKGEPEDIVYSRKNDIEVRKYT